MTDTTAVATSAPKQTHPLVQLRERMDARQHELRAALPDDVATDKFIRAVMTSAQLNPEILACSWQSIWSACLRACRDGLLPDGIEGAIVPYKSSATWIAMYQGQLRRFRRSGQFKWITANVVRQGEDFLHFIDENGEHFKHVPGDSFDAPITKIYAMAMTKDGGLFCTVLSKAEADKIRSMSRASREDSPWRQWESEMYKKTALRRLLKVLPSARDIMADDEFEENDNAPPAPSAPTPLRARGSAAALEQFAASAPASTSPLIETGPNGGEPGEIETPETDAVSAARTTEALDLDPAAAADAIAEAWEQGKQAKANGIHRRALPPELRTPDRNREAIAWQAGHDGKDMPEFSQASEGDQR